MSLEGIETVKYEASVHTSIRLAGKHVPILDPSVVEEESSDVVSLQVKWGSLNPTQSLPCRRCCGTFDVSKGKKKQGKQWISLIHDRMKLIDPRHPVSAAHELDLSQLEGVDKINDHEFQLEVSDTVFHFVGPESNELRDAIGKIDV